MAALCSLLYPSQQMNHRILWIVPFLQISAKPSHFTYCCCLCPCINHHMSQLCYYNHPQSWFSCLESCFLWSILHTAHRPMFLTQITFYFSLLKMLNITPLLWGWNPNSLICLQGLSKLCSLLSHFYAALLSASQTELLFHKWPMFSLNSGISHAWL